MTVKGLFFAIGVLSSTFCWAAFVRAEITYYAKDDGNYFPKPRTVSVGSAQATILAAQLPGVGRTIGRLKPAGWKARVHILLIDDKGKKIQVHVNHYTDRWTWGQGNRDFAPGPKLKSLLARLEPKR